MALEEIKTREFFKQYAETYVKARIKQGGEWGTYLFRSGTWDGERSSVELGGSDRNSSAANFYLNDVEIDIKFPNAGLYKSPKKYGNTVFLLVRVPHRQWRWGLCKSNCALYNVLGNLREISNYTYSRYRESVPESALNFLDYNLDWQIANEIFFPKYSSFEEGVKLLSKAKEPLVVLNKDFFLSLSTKDKGIVLWKWDIPIAHITVESDLLHCVDTSLFPTMKQEVLDFYAKERNFSAKFIN